MQKDFYTREGYDCIDDDGNLQGVVSVKGSSKASKMIGLMCCCCCCCCCCLLVLVFIVAIYYALCKEWIGIKYSDNNFHDPFRFVFDAAHGLTDDSPIIIRYDNDYGTFVLRTGGSGDKDLMIHYETRASWGFEWMLTIPSTTVTVTDTHAVDLTAGVKSTWNPLLTCVRQNVEIIIPPGHPVTLIDVDNRAGEFHVDLNATNPVTYAKLGGVTNTVQVHNIKADRLDISTTKGWVELGKRDVDAFPVLGGVVTDELTVESGSGNVFGWNVLCDLDLGCPTPGLGGPQYPYEIHTDLGTVFMKYDDEFTNSTFLPPIDVRVTSTSFNLFTTHIVDIKAPYGLLTNHTLYLETEASRLLGLIDLGGPSITVPSQAGYPLSLTEDTNSVKAGCLRNTTEECPALTKALHVDVAMRQVSLDLRSVEW